VEQTRGEKEGMGEKERERAAFIQALELEAYPLPPLSGRITV